MDYKEFMSIALEAHEDIFNKEERYKKCQTLWNNVKDSQELLDSTVLKLKKKNRGKPRQSTILSCLSKMKDPKSKYLIIFILFN